MPDDARREPATGRRDEPSTDAGRSDAPRRGAGRDPGTVLITGCSSGIGRATALTFLEDDWTVYATARDVEDLVDLAEAGCETAQLDVQDPEAVERVVDMVVAEDGRIDALVNNAGFGLFGPVEEVPTEALAHQMDVNLYGPHRLIQAVLPHMREQERGVIVNVSSTAGRVAFPGSGPYSASKFALEALSDSLRGEVDPFGIDVVVVEPGPVESQFTDRVEDEADRLRDTGAYPWFDKGLEDYRAFGGGGPAAISPREVAEAIHHAATCPDPDPRYPVGMTGSLANYGRYLPDRIRDAVFGLVRRFLSR